ncbi:hypothetical protein C1646_762394 [Rhizophagus diaphanus]|nr:hypothetical protein C1646_762394 [Rhizophagus diaphanus] [Rhizophagus sp. MUCL 43196]
MAHPIDRILVNHLPGIADRIHEIRQHTEGRVLLTPNNLENRYDNINHFLGLIRQDVIIVLNDVIALVDLQQNLNNITAERDQYQNLLNAENRLVRDLRHQLNEARAQTLRTDRMLTNALRDERNARREYGEIAENRKERIGELLREKFAFRLLIQRKGTQIGEHRRNAHRLTVRYNNDMQAWQRRYNTDTERWRRRHTGCIRQAQNWKGQFRASQAQNNILQQQNNNLQQQIFALQNNAPVNQQIGMAGYAPPRFSGSAYEDVDDFIKDFRLYLTAAGIATNNAAGKQRAIAMFESCLTGKAADWFTSKLKNKKWRLTHVRCGNAVANMAAIIAMNNVNITATRINAPDGTVPPAWPAACTGAHIIPAHDVHTDEDWFYAGGEPVDNATPNNVPNGVLNNNNAIVFPDINISQVIYWIKRHFPTEVQKQQEVIFGTLTQGSRPIREYYKDIQKYARYANIGLERPLNEDLIETMEQIEKEKDNILYGGNAFNLPVQKKQEITSEDIEKIVNSRIQVIKNTQKDTPYDKLEMIAMRLGYPDSSPRDVDSLNKFIEKEIEKLGHETFYTRVLRKKPRRRTYASKKTTKKTGKTKRRCSNCGRTGHTKTNCSSKKRSRKVNYVQANDISEESTSEESETEESNSDSNSGVRCYMNSRDDVSETETESETESSSDCDNDEPYRCNKAKKKKSVKKDGKEAEQRPRRKEVAKKKSKKKSKSKDNGVVISRKPKKDINVIQDIFRASFKSLIRSLIAQCPKEIVQEIFGHLNKEYIGAKDLLLSQYIPNYSPEEKEEIWKQVSEVYNDILLPLIEAVYQLQVNYITTENAHVAILPVFSEFPKQKQQSIGLGQNILALNQAIKTYQKAQSTNADSHQTQLCKSSVICYPRPFEINFIRLNAPNDVATICCKIDTEIIPYAVIDTGSDSSIISQNIAEKLGIEIDKNSSHEITGIASLAKTVGTIYDLPITIGQGKNELTITDEFLVIETERDKNGKEKSLIILGVPWQHKAGWGPITKECSELCLRNDLYEHSLRVKKLEQQLEKALDNSLIILDEYTKLSQRFSKEQDEK